MISLDDLRFVEALHRTGSMSAAARALNVTPPAISMRLKKLEAELGINLVVRNSRHTRFTSEGEKLVSERRRSSRASMPCLASCEPTAALSPETCGSSHPSASDAPSSRR